MGGRRSLYHKIRIFKFKERGGKIMITNLKRIRQANNLSQSKLAEKAEVNFRMIQNYEQGFKDINKAQAITLYKIAQVLDCMIEDLLELEVKYDND
jgi:transcriptional regulator with XRE-family HTH domain